MVGSFAAEAQRKKRQGNAASGRDERKSAPPDVTTRCTHRWMTCDALRADGKDLDGLRCAGDRQCMCNVSVCVCVFSDVRC